MSGASRKERNRTRLGIERCEPRRVLAAVPGLDDVQGDVNPEDEVWHTLTSGAEVLEVDLSIRITNGQEIYEPSSSVKYTVIVTNDGPDAATGARVAVSLPEGIHGTTWSAIYSPTASGSASGVATGSSAIDTLVNLPAGSAAIFTLSGSVDAQAFGQLRVSATVSPGAGSSDQAIGDNASADVDRRPLLVVGAESARLREGVALPPQVQVIDAATGSVRASFEAFQAVPLSNGRSLRPGARVTFADVDGDGVDEILATPSSGPIGELRVFRQLADGSYGEDRSWRNRPFGNGYRGGLQLTSGDFDGDGDMDVAVSSDRGAGEIALLRSTGTAFAAFGSQGSFTPFSSDYRGSSRLAASDLTGDKRAELVVASGPRIAPVVKVYGLMGSRPEEIDSITPSSDIKGAVSVSVSRFDADAIPDVIVSGGRGQASRVEIYDGTVNAAVANAKRSATEGFTTPYASSETANAAVFASGVDLDGDGRLDRVVTCQGRGGSEVSARTFTRTGTAVTSGTPTFGSETSLDSSPINTRLVQTASGLQYQDLVVGTGPQPTNGQRISVHYVGSLVNGAIFDNSRTRAPSQNSSGPTDGSPFEFTLGARQVIAGWDEGLSTMRVGGVRRLIIPSNLGYGSTGQGQIPPNATLVFDVELLTVT